MSEQGSSSSGSNKLGRTIGLVIAIILAVVAVFIVVMCTAGSPKVLESPADFPAPNN